MYKEKIFARLRMLFFFAIIHGKRYNMIDADKKMILEHAKMQIEEKKSENEYTKLYENFYETFLEKNEAAKILSGKKVGFIYEEKKSEYRQMRIDKLLQDSKEVYDNEINDLEELLDDKIYTKGWNQADFWFGELQRLLKGNTPRNDAQWLSAIKNSDLNLENSDGAIALELLWNHDISKEVWDAVASGTDFSHKDSLHRTIAHRFLLLSQNRGVKLPQYMLDSIIERSDLTPGIYEQKSLSVLEMLMVCQYDLTDAQWTKVLEQSDLGRSISVDKGEIVLGTGVNHAEIAVHHKKKLPLFVWERLLNSSGKKALDIYLDAGITLPSVQPYIDVCENHNYFYKILGTPSESTLFYTADILEQKDNLNAFQYCIQNDIQLDAAQWAHLSKLFTEKDAELVADKPHLQHLLKNTKKEILYLADANQPVGDLVFKSDLNALHKNYNYLMMMLRNKNTEHLDYVLQNTDLSHSVDNHNPLSCALLSGVQLKDYQWDILIDNCTKLHKDFLSKIDTSSMGDVQRYKLLKPKTYKFKNLLTRRIEKPVVLPNYFYQKLKANCEKVINPEYRESIISLCDKIIAMPKQESHHPIYIEYPNILETVYEKCCHTEVHSDVAEILSMIDERLKPAEDNELATIKRYLKNNR